jgi:hypothetical protein
MNFIQSYTLPVSNSIKRLREQDFALETRDKICIYDDACNIVLFYTESPESKKILNVFKTVAETVAGPSFAACNVLLEKRVAEALMEVANVKDHPFNWMTTRPYPYIVVYRRGYPVNFYDGPADTDILTNFSINVANLQEFHIRNYVLTQNVKNEMWTEYRMKNPYMIGGPAAAPMQLPKTPFIAAVPYNDTKIIF